MSATSSSGCVYCGLPRARVRDRRHRVRVARACGSHLDLLAVDPFYNPDGYLSATVAEPLEAALAAGLESTRRGSSPPPTSLAALSSPSPTSSPSSSSNTRGRAP